jgi:Arc/MetJ-type ribon-helix-helix transcriptional regulator
MQITFIFSPSRLLTMPERRYKYHTVNLPDSLAALIGEVVESRKHGYTSIPDFVKEAVRRYLRELGYLQ